MTDTINDIVMRDISHFLGAIPNEIKHHPDMVAFAPYYILENIKTFIESSSNIIVDINKPFNLFGTKFFAGYENYFVACIIKYAGVDPNATFKMPIQ